MLNGMLFELLQVTVVKIKIVLLVISDILGGILHILHITAGRENHSDSDCFGVAVLSHGDNDVIYGVDSIIALDNFVAPIKSCSSLVGKPKIFIFQVRIKLFGFKCRYGD